VKISGLGEFGLIGLISDIVERRQKLPSGLQSRLIAGIGDDAAAWRSDYPVSLATIDCLTQDVHFSPGTSSWEDLGWKALAVSLSDIAAMGGTPEHALVSLGLPDDTEVDSVTALYEGMIELANQFDVSISGGNFSRSAIVFINTSVFGGIESQDRLLRRSAARPGDIIAVTGSLGGAAAGLEMFTKNISFEHGLNKSLKAAFFRPRPRVAEGRVLSEMGVKAAIDISDGLLSDLGHLCQASGASARVDADCLPVSPDAMSAFPERALDIALGGGEDYELLFTADAAKIEQAKATLSCPVTIIGEIVADDRAGISVFSNGQPYHTKATGWQHFA
jgi:thiamine-monophosphate kinase